MFSAILSASALVALAAAVPLPGSDSTLLARSVYYVCGASGFKGTCNHDPCDGQTWSWCSDYQYRTYTPVGTTPPTTPLTGPAPAPVTGKSWYVCYSNGFKGDCTVDACNLPWCPDYTFGTYTPVTSPAPAPVPTPIPVPVPSPVPASAPKQHYVCSSNGFNGDCTVNACNLSWCPDYESKTYTPKTTSTLTKRAMEVHCQLLAGHFDGLCSIDPCYHQSVWCPDYVEGTYVLKTSVPVEPTKPVEPANPVEPVTPVKPIVEPTKATSETRFIPGQGKTCQSGLQFHSCMPRSGVPFNGCCSHDPCNNQVYDWCNDYAVGFYSW